MQKPVIVLIIVIAVIVIIGMAILFTSLPNVPHEINTTTTVSSQIQYLYIANTGTGSNSVSVVDTKTNGLAATVQVGGQPIAIAVSPNGKFAYVANGEVCANVSTTSGVASCLYENGSVSIINTATNNITQRIPADAPSSITFTPNSTYAYITNAQNDTVSVVDVGASRIVNVVGVGSSPIESIITPDGKYLYVLNVYSGTISVIRTKDNSLITTILLPSNNSFAFESYGPMAISQDGKTLFDLNAYSETAYIIDTATNKITKTIPLNFTAGIPTGVAVAPNDQFIYILDEENSSISIINTTTYGIRTLSLGERGCGNVYLYNPIVVSPKSKEIYTVNNCGSSINVVNASTDNITTIPVGYEPSSIQTSPDGSYLYVTNWLGDYPLTSGLNGTVSVIDTATNNVVNTITVGSMPSSMAIT
jgi:YVTN family beta-propeller protein